MCVVFAAAFAACTTGEKGENLPTGYNLAGNTFENTGKAPETEENTAVNEEKPAMLTVGQLLKLTPQKMLSSAQYDTEKFTTPFYNSQIQYNEGFFLLENESGGVDDVRLMFPAEMVLEVRSNDLSVLYEEGKDYALNDDGTLSIPAGSAITPLKRSEFFVASGQWSEEGGAVINTTSAMYKGHYNVTYIRTDEYTGTTAEHGRKKLVSFSEKADKGEAVEILVLGDSIAAGAGVKDFPNWAETVKRGVEYYSQSEVTLYNAAVPGIHSGEYVGLIDGDTSKVAESIRADAVKKFEITEAHKASADLVVIAIGGNDAGGWCGPNGTATAAYKSNVAKMTAYIREANPDCSILLVSCMQTNPKVFDTNSKNYLAAASFAEYEAALGEIVSENRNMALANVYGVESELLLNKNIEDMLGDNINHPSDYMSRVYAQVVLAALFDL